VNILLVTGQLAKPMVERYAEQSRFKPKVVALPTSVAALMTPRYIARQLRGERLEGVDMILVPGLIKGDVSVVSKATGIPAFKGPRHAADLPLVLDSVAEMRLSDKIPACDLIREELNSRALDLLKKVEAEEEELMKEPGNMRIGGLAVGRSFPAKVIAEIVDAPKLSDEEIRRRAAYYVESGADIVDVGMIAGAPKPSEAARCVRAVKGAVKQPVSVDSMDVEEIEAAVSVGVDLILSVDAGNIAEVSRFASHIPVVVIPTDFGRRLFPREAGEKVRLLERNVELARRMGFTKIIVDPILDPLINPGAAESIAACREYRRRHPETPMLLGVGNVTELLDADTQGVNALLSGIAAELDVSLLLTTEVSDKARGCIGELSRLSKMMYLAKMRESPPKELGLDMLVLKESRLKDEPYDRRLEEGSRVIYVEQVEDYRADPKGCFKILLDRDEGSIVVMHYSQYRLKKPDVVIKGRRAVDVYRTAVRMNLVSTLEHAAYLGSEVEKAEMALKLGRSYVQDTPLF